MIGVKKMDINYKVQYETLEQRIARVQESMLKMSNKQWEKEFDISKEECKKKYEYLAKLKETLTPDDLTLIDLIRRCNNYKLGTLYRLIDLVELKLESLRADEEFLNENN